MKAWSLKNEIQNRFDSTWKWTTKLPTFEPKKMQDMDDFIVSDTRQCFNKYSTLEIKFMSLLNTPTSIFRYEKGSMFSVNGTG